MEALTERLRTALESLTVNAERWEDLRFVDAVRSMALELAGLAGEDLDRVEVTRRLLEEFYRARLEHPTELHALLVKAKAYVRMLDLLRLRDGDVAGETQFGSALIHTWKRLAVVLAGYPPALYGWLFNFLPYFLTGRLALAAGGERDVVATYKLYAGLLLFPLFYLGQGAMMWRAAGPWWAALAVALGAPLRSMGHAILRPQERVRAPGFGHRDPGPAAGRERPSEGNARRGRGGSQAAGGDVQVGEQVAGNGTNRARSFQPPAVTNRVTESTPMRHHVE